MNKESFSRSSQFSEWGTVFLVSLVFVAFVCCVGAIAFWLVFVNCYDTPAVLEKAAVDAQPIITALYRYKSDHNEFPRDLAKLVPDYLPELRIPLTDRWICHKASWSYETSFDRNEFTFTIGFFPPTEDGNSHWISYLRYDSDVGDWHINFW